MAETMMMLDGNIQTVLSLNDFLWLVEGYMGMEARRWLEGNIRNMEEEYGADVVEDLEGELKREKDHHKRVMRELREHSEAIAGLIRKKEIDRKALSAEAGSIGRITWKEANR